MIFIESYLIELKLDDRNFSQMDSKRGARERYLRRSHRTIKNAGIFSWADFTIRESLESDKIKKFVKSNRNSGISHCNRSSDS